MVRVGALAQAVSTLVVLVIALRSFESDGPEIEQLFTAFTVKQLFITLAIAVPVFDLAVIVGSWALPRRVRPI
jgi:hypothetical protein